MQYRQVSPLDKFLSQTDRKWKTFMSTQALITIYMSKKLHVWRDPLKWSRLFDNIFLCFLEMAIYIQFTVAGSLYLPNQLCLIFMVFKDTNVPNGIQFSYGGSFKIKRYLDSVHYM